MKCKICGGQCGLVCKGLGFSSAPARAPVASDRIQPARGHAVPVSGGNGDRTAGIRKDDAGKDRQASSAVREASAKKGKGGRPRLGAESETNAARKPWVLQNMSERTWYRREAERRKANRRATDE